MLTLVSPAGPALLVEHRPVRWLVEAAVGRVGAMTPAAARVCSVTLGQRPSCAGILGESTGAPSVTTHQMLNSSSPSHVIRAALGTMQAPRQRRNAWRPRGQGRCEAVVVSGMESGRWFVFTIKRTARRPSSTTRTVVGAGATTASDRLGDPLMLPIGD